MVFDFGGGTLDITVMTANDGKFDVKGTEGDTHLGGWNLLLRILDLRFIGNTASGQDFTKALFDDVVKTFESDHPGIDWKNDASRVRLLEACDTAKKQLSARKTMETRSQYLVCLIFQLVEC